MRNHLRLVLFIVEVCLRAAIAGTLIFLWRVPASYFDGGADICYWKVHYGIECPGCGLTRGTQHMLHGEWKTAIEYNPLSAIVTGLIVAVWTLNWYGLYKIVKQFPDLNTPTQKVIRKWLVKLDFVKQAAPKADASS
ncbi:MAG: DUF2752 domain-containing protein [Bacteroidia bacterium]|nr:DUF2752 domain-containing protein [Bacteroidia bacterium]MCX7652220.1 DUF2752 domain-containing protein [Bacteroidia bacterium]MDW8416482.1 DUF2752 domain-containing protein [Bacteroidia bacterium]